MSGPAPLWIIDPSLAQREDEGVRTIASGWPVEPRVFRPALVEGDGPGPGDGYDAAAVVLMGSAASPLDTYPWLERLAGWLTPIARGERRMPLLGICFGHQLLARCGGGQVGFVRPDRQKFVGVEESELQHSRLLPGIERLRVVVSHREEVKRVPPGYEIVARRGPIAADGMQHRTLPLYSFQFHPEAGGEFAGRAGIPLDALDTRQRADSRLLLDAFREVALAAR